MAEPTDPAVGTDAAANSNPGKVGAAVGSGSERQRSGPARKAGPRPLALYPGRPISLRDEQARQRPNSRYVVLAGPVDSGKTTIVTSIYEAFHEGEVGEFMFAGSETLVALEERCHENRGVSGLDVANTPRTSRTADTELIHFVVAGTKSRSRTNVLITDVTGELFEEILARPASASSLPILAMASRVQIVVDGRMLTAMETRDYAIYSGQMLARAIAEHGALLPDTRVDCLISKLDLVTDAGEKALQFALQGAETILASLASARVGAVLTICARSQSTASSVKSGTGLSDVLQLWTGTNIPVRKTSEDSGPGS